MARFYIDSSRDTQDRFDLSKFMEFVVDNYDPLTSALLDDLPTVEQGLVFTVQGEESRPNVVSKKIYGSNQYWWVVLLYNNLIDFRDFVTGDDLIAPSIVGLESLYFSLKAKQTAASALQ